MDISFARLRDFPRGTFYRLLSDAYAFAPRYEEACGARGHADEAFFLDNPEIGDRYCMVTTLNGEAIGLIAWDPRHLPEYAIVGDNCIITKYKGHGYGVRQLREAVRRMFAAGAQTIYVSTDNELLPAQRMYERVGFQRLERNSLAPWQLAQGADIYYALSAQQMSAAASLSREAPPDTPDTRRP